MSGLLMLTKANNSPEGRRIQGRGWNGHFLGFRARKNCEEMPVIPASIVRAYLDEPRRIPYLLLWKDDRHDGEIMEAVRLARYHDPHDSSSPENYVELKRTDGDYTVLRIIWRMLPRNGGRAVLLLCPYCNTPRRFVYGWEWDSFSGWSNRVRRISWRCRSCAMLRYSSEGGYLCQGVRAERMFAGLGFPGKLPTAAAAGVVAPLCFHVDR